MTAEIEPTDDDFYTKKHKKLTRIAALANFFAWVALILMILYALIQIANSLYNYVYQNTASGQAQWNLLTMFSNDPVYTICLVIKLLSELLNSFVAWLVLKGISLGLYMIVETDMNYKEKAKEASHE